MTHTENKYKTKIGDFVIKKVGDWIQTGVVIASSNLSEGVFRVCWTTLKELPVSNSDFHECYEYVPSDKLFIIRSDSDIPSSFLPPN